MSIYYKLSFQFSSLLSYYPKFFILKSLSFYSNYNKYCLLSFYHTINLSLITTFDYFTIKIEFVGNFSIFDWYLPISLSPFINILTDYSPFIESNLQRAHKYFLHVVQYECKTIKLLWEIYFKHFMHINGFWSYFYYKELLHEWVCIFFMEINYF